MQVPGETDDISASFDPFFFLLSIVSAMLNAKLSAHLNTALHYQEILIYTMYGVN